jgi:anti-sigma regulatory factor (Ser/Thr protein kinase)
MNLPGAVVRAFESYPASSDSIARARRMLVAFAEEVGATLEQQDNVRLVVSEAVTNVVQHAYCDGGGEVHVTAALVSDELWILIADDGEGIRPELASPGLGFGLPWMAQFSDGMRLLTSSTGGVEVRLRFDLSGEEPPQAKPDPAESTVQTREAFPAQVAG